MDRLQAMEAFVAVVDAGTFTRAADRMRLPRRRSPPWCRTWRRTSRCAFCNRTTRRVSVTADGSAYYERCLRILAEVAETEAALGCSAKCPGGRLRVSVGNSFGRNVLIPALPDFFARYPDIRLELACSDRPVDLVAEQVDCVVRGGDLEDSTLVARKIGSLACVTCATPGYLAQHGMPQHPRDLQGHRCVSFILQQTGRVCEWDYTRGGEHMRESSPQATSPSTRARPTSPRAGPALASCSRPSCMSAPISRRAPWSASSRTGAPTRTRST